MPAGDLIVLRLGFLGSLRAYGGGIVLQVRSSTRCLLSWSHRLWNNSRWSSILPMSAFGSLNSLLRCKRYLHFTHKNWGLGKWVLRTTQTVAEPRSACRDSDSNPYTTPPCLIGQALHMCCEWLEQSPPTPSMKELSSWTPVLSGLRFCFHRCRGQSHEKNIPYSNSSWWSHWESLLPEESSTRKVKTWSPICHQASHGCAALAVHAEPVSSRCWVLLVMHPLQGPTVLNCFKQPIK